MENRITVANKNYMSIVASVRTTKLATPSPQLHIVPNVISGSLIEGIE